MVFNFPIFDSARPIIGHSLKLAFSGLHLAVRKSAFLCSDSAPGFLFPACYAEAAGFRLIAIFHFSLSAKARFSLRAGRGLNSRLLCRALLALTICYQPFAICFPTGFTAIY